MNWAFNAHHPPVGAFASFTQSISARLRMWRNTRSPTSSRPLLPFPLRPRAAPYDHPRSRRLPLPRWRLEIKLNKQQLMAQQNLHLPVCGRANLPSHARPPRRRRASRLAPGRTQRLLFLERADDQRLGIWQQILPPWSYGLALDTSPPPTSHTKSILKTPPKIHSKAI